MDWNAVGASAGEGLVGAAVVMAVLLALGVPWREALAVGLFTGGALLLVGIVRAGRSRRHA